MTTALLTTSSSAWDADRLIPDAFIDDEVKRHVISTHVLCPQIATQLPTVLDSKTSQRRLTNVIHLMATVAKRQVDQQRQAVDCLLAAFGRRSEGQQAMICSLPSVQLFKAEHLQAMPNQTTFALYLCLMNSPNTEPNEFVSVGDLTGRLRMTSADRRVMSKAFSRGQQLLHEQRSLFDQDLTKICKYLMADYYGEHVDIKSV